MKDIQQSTVGQRATRVSGIGRYHDHHAGRKDAGLSFHGQLESTFQHIGYLLMGMVMFGHWMSSLDIPVDQGHVGAMDHPGVVAINDLPRWGLAKIDEAHGSRVS